jgi:hypothetical protein
MSEGKKGGLMERLRARKQQQLPPVLSEFKVMLSEVHGCSVRIEDIGDADRIFGPGPHVTLNFEDIYDQNLMWFTHNGKEWVVDEEQQRGARPEDRLLSCVIQQEGDLDHLIDALTRTRERLRELKATATTA